MTEEERPEAKEQEACFAAIREIVQEISRLMDAAYQQYSRLVEQVLNGRITEEREIERIMDGLVDFGDDPRLLELYKTLCRHVYYKYPALVGEHTALFRLQFEETEDGDTIWWWPVLRRPGRLRRSVSSWRFIGQAFPYASETQRN